jgi:DNA-binding LytR/AlgR family response regulator
MVHTRRAQHYVRGDERETHLECRGRLSLGRAGGHSRDARLASFYSQAALAEAFTAARPARPLRIRPAGTARLPLVIFTTPYDRYALRAFEVNALDYLLKPVAPGCRAADFCQGRRALLVCHSHGRRAPGERRQLSPPLFRQQLATSAGSPNYLEERLDPAIFFRAGRKHILNLRFIESIDPWVKERFLVRLKGNFQVEMSRRRAQKLKDLMSL